MPVERRGQAIRVTINLVNWQQEEPTGCGGGRQLSLDGTSRVTGDCHARFCERLGVKSPGAPRRQRATAVPTATTVQRAAKFHLQTLIMWGLQPLVAIAIRFALGDQARAVTPESNWYVRA
jgi:hypothetical protein